MARYKLTKTEESQGDKHFYSIECLDEWDFTMEKLQEKMVSLDKVVDEFRHFIIDYFSNLFPTGEEVKYVTDLFRKRLEK